MDRNPETSITLTRRQTTADDRRSDLPSSPKTRKKYPIRIFAPFMKKRGPSARVAPARLTWQSRPGQ